MNIFVHYQVKKCPITFVFIAFKKKFYSIFLFKNIKTVHYNKFDKKYQLIYKMN